MIHEEFEAPEAEIQADLLDFLEELSDKGMVEDASAGAGVAFSSAVARSACVT